MKHYTVIVITTFLFVGSPTIAMAKSQSDLQNLVQQVQATLSAIQTNTQIATASTSIETRFSQDIETITAALSETETHIESGDYETATQNISDHMIPVIQTLIGLLQT